MTCSMTGFGRATVELEGEHISIEVNTVNHRFLDCSFRLPHAWAATESALREVLKGALGRGKVNINVRRDYGVSGRQTVRFDGDVARQYMEAGREISNILRTTEAMSLDTLVTLEGVFFLEEPEQDLDTVAGKLAAGLNEALEQLNAVRENEGRALAEDIRAHVTEMRDALSAVEARLPELSAAYEERLRTRVAELNAETGLTEDRIALEVTLQAEKSDVNEEVVRLTAHLDQTLELLDASEPVGRDLNFLAQEIQREVNTLGAKLRDIGVSREVLRMKSELEKIREQVQNIE